MKLEDTKKISEHPNGSRVLVVPANVIRDWEYQGYPTDECKATYDTETKEYTLSPLGSDEEKQDDQL